MFLRFNDKIGNTLCVPSYVTRRKKDARTTPLVYEPYGQIISLSRHTQARRATNCCIWRTRPSMTVKKEKKKEKGILSSRLPKNFCNPNDCAFLGYRLTRIRILLDRWRYRFFLSYSFLLINPLRFGSAD